ncbi:MAG: YMGG-like glycine zipper-containing protein [Stenotrophobium sp.]
MARILRNTFTAIAGAAVLAGCVQMPTRPNVAVMPAPNKPFEVFVADDTICRQYAQSQVGGTEQTQNNAVGHAVVGTAVGAAAGGLIADSSRGAGVGAGVGLVAGALSGADAGDNSTYGLQRRYDIAYEQCMYAKGNQVPGYATVTPIPPPRSGAPPPPPAHY